MRIRTHLVLMAAAILLPVVLASAIALQKIRDGEREAALRGLRETVRATTLMVDREVKGSLLSLKALGNSKNLETADMEGFYAQAKAMNQPPDVWTLLLDASGRQVLNTITPFGTPPPPPVAAERVARVLETQQPLVTDLIMGPVINRPLTVVYVPAAAAGGRSYVVAQGFAVDHWRRTVLQAGLPPDWIVAVIDRNGRFISRSHRAEELLGQPARPELVAAAAASSAGLIRHNTIEGIEAYDAFAHSPLTGWTIAVAAPVASIEAEAQRAMQLALVGVLVALAFAVVAAAAFGRRFIRAVEEAGAAAVALGQGRKPAPPATAIEEVNVLNRALVEAGSLLDTERLSRQAAETERERLLHSETAAREAAQAQNFAKDQFLAMLGHELRNPLAAISGATSLLELGGLDRSRTGRYLEIIRRQNRHLGHIVNDLLDVSRLMAGKIELERQPLELAACVAACVEALRTTERAIGYRIEMDTQPVWVNADPVRVEQILNNLLTNALKFSSSGGEVRVEVREERGQAVVTVSDGGAGMAPSLIPRVFEPFVQGPAPENRMQSGMGIGLALVKQLVELHGGLVHAASPGPGEGSTFTFWMPTIAAPEVPAGEAPAPARTGRRLVYVEDSDDARATMGELLRAMGYQVVEAADGASALSAVASSRPDAVILDLGLPDIDGYEVARRLREDPATRHIPLVALTGYGQPREPGDRAPEVDAYLVKPVEPDVLASTIEEVLERSPSSA